MENEQISFFANNDADVKRQIEELREKILYHNKKYYEEDNPEISDYEYDKLTQKLRKLESLHPEYVVADSPSQLIGGKNKDIFSKVVHEVQMQSLQDVFSLSDVKDFIDKLELKVGHEVEYVVETKIDGVSVSLEYENGKLVRGSTRGDGNVRRRCNSKFNAN